MLVNEGRVADVDVIVAALLHDTVEDTLTTHEELAEHFGEKIAGVVAEVTDDKHLEKHERKQRQVEHAPHLSDEAKLVKLAATVRVGFAALNPPYANIVLLQSGRVG